MGVIIPYLGDIAADMTGIISGIKSAYISGGFRDGI
jgi:hypothetical protein